MDALQGADPQQFVDEQSAASPCISRRTNQRGKCMACPYKGDRADRLQWKGKSSTAHPAGAQKESRGSHRTVHFLIIRALLARPAPVTPTRQRDLGDVRMKPERRKRNHIRQLEAPPSLGTKSFSKRG